MKTAESLNGWFVWYVNSISEAIKNEGKIMIFYDK